MGRKLVGVAALVALVGVAACGESAPLSRAEFAKRANAICKRRDAAISAAAVGQTSFRAVMKRGLPAATKSLDELSALKPPSALKDKYARFLFYDRAQLAQVKRMVATPASSAASTGGREGRNARLGHARAALGRELGLVSCL